MGALGLDLIPRITLLDFTNDPNGAPIINNTVIAGIGAFKYDLTFNYSVTNSSLISKQSSGKFWWMGLLYKNGEQMAVLPASQIGPLAPGENKTFTTPHYTGLARKGAVLVYVAKLFVDPFHDVAEFNEDNNTYTFRFMVETQPW